MTSLEKIAKNLEKSRITIKLRPITAEGIITRFDTSLPRKSVSKNFQAELIFSRNFRKIPTEYTGIPFLWPPSLILLNFLVYPSLSSYDIYQVLNKMGVRIYK